MIPGAKGKWLRPGVFRLDDNTRQEFGRRTPWHIRLRMSLITRLAGKSIAVVTSVSGRSGRLELRAPFVLAAGIDNVRINVAGEYPILQAPQQ